MPHADFWSRVTPPYKSLTTADYLALIRYWLAVPLQTIHAMATAPKPHTPDMAANDIFIRAHHAALALESEAAVRGLDSPAIHEAHKVLAGPVRAWLKRNFASPEANLVQYVEDAAVSPHIALNERDAAVLRDGLGVMRRLAFVLERAQCGNAAPAANNETASKSPAPTAACGVAPPARRRRPPWVSREI